MRGDYRACHFEGANHPGESRDRSGRRGIPESAHRVTGLSRFEPIERSYTFVVTLHGYAGKVPDLRARDVRNDLGRVLTRVLAGERLRVTLRGLPVADLVPVSSRPRTMLWAAFWSAVAASPTDAGLREDLRLALPGDTDDLQVA